MDWIRVAGVCGFLGVGLGAFGSHALKARLTPEMLSVWNTAVLYHLIHALALLALALYGRAAGIGIGFGGAAFLSGLVLFSGSLYALALSGMKVLGAITPLGGLALLAGWSFIALRGLRG